MLVSLCKIRRQGTALGDCQVALGWLWGGSEVVLGRLWDGSGAALGGWGGYLGISSHHLVCVMNCSSACSL